MVLYREFERRQPALLQRLIIIIGTGGHPEYGSFLEQALVFFPEKPFGRRALNALARQVPPAARLYVR